jgi:hypothetical protein
MAQQENLISFRKARPFLVDSATLGPCREQCGILTPEVSLTHMHEMAMLMSMRTTLIIDESLLERARVLTGIRKKTALVHAGLEALIAREAARRLAALAGSEPALRIVPRRTTRVSR